MDGQDQGVVVSDVVANSVTTDFEYDVLDSDYSSSVATLKSLTHCEFVSGQTKVCSVRGNLAKCSTRSLISTNQWHLSQLSRLTLLQKFASKKENFLSPFHGLI